MKDLPRSTLDATALGQRVRVVRLDGDDGMCRRLHDLGFWPGTEVDVVHRAPWLDPTLYALRGQRLALRRNEAARIHVESV